MLLYSTSETVGHFKALKVRLPCTFIEASPPLVAFAPSLQASGQTHGYVTCDNGSRAEKEATTCEEFLETKGVKTGRNQFDILQIYLANFVFW